MIKALFLLDSKQELNHLLFKPLRVQEWRGFENYIGETNETESEENLNNYTVIKSLGSGAAGIVDLVKHKETDKLYALKTIPLSHLNEKERNLAEWEMYFLKVLSGPTLIKSYHSYIEKDNIYIIMEYAEGGSLDEKIKLARFKKQFFDTDTILNWISQVILGVMLIHSKNILHRDLKCQNIFLNKEGIVKIGDFGISKELETMSRMAETNIGTPYYMAPEAWRGESYGEKADIWAIGWILYELTLLRKPFDADSVQGVFDKIINKPISLEGEKTDTDIKVLIYTMLEYDQKKRPNIWKLSTIPWINERIHKFIKENKWEDSVNWFIEMKSDEYEYKEQDEEQIDSIFDSNKLDVLAHIMRTDIKMEETKAGWFKGSMKCTNGNNIFNWIKTHAIK